MKPTDDQILERLRGICQVLTEDEVPFTPELKIFDLFGYLRISLIEPWEFVFEVENAFGVYLSSENWINFLGSMQHEPEARKYRLSLSVKDLIDFIRFNLPEVSFEPVNICGKVCAPAGAFIGIQDLAESVCGSDVKFGPSSQIRSLIRGKTLEKFWNQLRFLSEVSLPELQHQFSTPAIMLSSVFVICYLVGGFHAILVGMFVIGMMSWIDELRSTENDLIGNFVFDYRLPDEIQSFRDLAEYIAHAKHPAT